MRRPSPPQRLRGGGDPTWATPHPRSRTPALLQLLEQVYPDPETFTTAEGFIRAHHDDVRAMADEVLDAERVAARIRFALEILMRPSGGSPWLRARVSALDAEARRRLARRR